MSENEGLLFHVDFQATKKALIITYTVKNERDVAIYLTNHAVRLDPEKGQIPDRSVVFVYVDRERDALHITKRKPPMPDKFVNPLLHFVTPVAPGQTYTEKIEIPLPVRTYAPYQNIPPGAVPEEKTFRQVYFSLGYINGQPGLQASESTCQGEKVYSLAPVLGKDGRPVATIDTTEHYLYSRMHGMKIPVLIYKLSPKG